ncbi:MAG: hypothetical protein JXQ29_10410 [Planctomycetes bacterium]|nr:hypothetical protein [Planctomycetota bacterium]
MRSSEGLSSAAEAEFFAGVLFAEQFFMKQSRVHRALERLVRRLEEAGIPYAILGAMALNEYGYRRVTEDVDVLLTREGLEAFKRTNLGRGYVEKFPGSKGLRDTEDDTPIDVVLSGDFPGDGKPKSVVFPDPEEIALAGERVRLLPLGKLIELKLASGLTAPHRLRDLADVMELIRRLKLDPDFADPLDATVREKYRELWHAAQAEDDA